MSEVNIFHGLIYKITNTINNKCYVEQTIGKLSKRMAAHRGLGEHKLSLAIRKHGWDKFRVEVIDWATNLTELNYKEWIWIHKLNCLDDKFGYNMKEGGNSKKLTSEVKLKISAKRKGCSVQESVKIKISESCKKLWEDVYFKEKMRQKTLDSWASDSKNERIRKNLVILQSEKIAKKRNEAIKSYYSTEEAKNMCRNRACHKTDAFKKKMSVVNSANARKRYDRLFMVYRAVLANKNGKFKNYQIGEKVGEWSSIKDCAESLNLYWTGISQCLNGKIKQFKGYIFILEEDYAKQA